MVSYIFTSWISKWMQLPEIFPFYWFILSKNFFLVQYSAARFLALHTVCRSSIDESIWTYHLQSSDLPQWILHLLQCFVSFTIWVPTTVFHWIILIATGLGLVSAISYYVSSHWHDWCSVDTVYQWVNWMNEFPPVYLGVRNKKSILGFRHLLCFQVFMWDQPMF